MPKLINNNDMLINDDLTFHIYCSRSDESNCDYLGGYEDVVGELIQITYVCGFLENPNEFQFVISGVRVINTKSYILK